MKTNQEFAGLSPTTRNAIRRHLIQKDLPCDPADIRQLIESGRVKLTSSKKDAGVTLDGDLINNFGPVRLRELCDWLKIPTPIREPRMPTEPEIKAAMTVLRRAGYEVTKK